MVGGGLFAYGAWLRLSALTARPLAVDEFYFLTGILSILQNGIPEFPGGGLYDRGVILQYLTAAVIWVQGDPIAGLRLVPALAGLGTAVLAVIYARRHLPLSASLVLGFIFLFSSWQVEFSLFGRMYAGFQLFTLAYLITFEEAVKRGTGNRVLVVSLVGIVGLGIHELALLFVPPLFLTALVFGEGGQGIRKIRWSLLLGPSVALVLGLVLRFTNFRDMGVAPPLPEGYTFPMGGPLLFPTVWGLGDTSLSVLVLFGLALVGFLLFFFLAPGKEISGMPRGPGWIGLAWAGLFLASALLHQFVVCGLVGVLLWRRYRDPEKGLQKPMKILFSAGIVLALTWIGLTGFLFKVGGIEAWGMPEDAGSLLGVWRRFFLAWPDLYGSVALQWFQDFPLLTTLFMAALGWRLFLVLDRPLKDLLLDPAMVLLYFILAVGVVQSLYVSIRYTHFLYPVAFLVLGQAFLDWFRMAGGRMPPGVNDDEARNAGPAMAVAVSAALLLTFAFSRDFHPTHLLDLKGPEASYRIGAWDGYARVWYQFQDVEGPSRFVVGNADAADAVVAVDVPVASYYLNRPHLVFVSRDRGWRRFIVVARNRGTIDLWSGQPLASTQDELDERLGEAETAWFMDAIPESPELREFLDRSGWEWESVFQGEDRRLQVIRATRPGPVRPSGP